MKTKLEAANHIKNMGEFYTAMIKCDIPFSVIDADKAKDNMIKCFDILMEES